MAGARSLLGAIRRTFAKSSCKAVAVVDSKQKISTLILEEAEAVASASASASDQTGFSGEVCCLDQRKTLSIEDVAAIKIQANFRGHLARRAFRALRSLVKLQALVRGAYVRRQARIAVHCMQVLVRLQVRVRARQLLSRSGHAELSYPA
ncbi:hypothetical protein J5N97_022695 [Dioscorea zingiberensis]|uniref:Uncharacterized protein n=1 Tax=Dioscorea zingiberensis TaxID=325984 RepID=A0A9D5CBP8_9LILI|nr:hypothetical protein J5N97_022695 [Dioscorea zingiberensis]